ncbi:MAG: undecaprenyldiphospho-muramoylpentapeptide beta-N-acetylglucosaminyltransferase [Alistipes sp.]|jgi:UDP-N-acetylglucosamine--N-acetylmuramyl-(pentapeptide) pyrophosphoryl-undecaprenol N-acetylglucosamine transferase|nr:undecaprenyldiphospho-muramoylpentapeptide beta-N-acetylglucosaminyltransferase [Alistipes sp.]
MNIILSGGGTGGHIYPAVAVAEALQRRLGADVRLLFVGARGKMEMEKIPALGYEIEGLPVVGLQRRLTFRNIVNDLTVPFRAVRSLRLARRVIRDFGADVVVGFGGYASAPVLRAAQSMGIPTVIQEQNSYAGLTNKVLGRRARAVCVAYDGMERFFPADRIAMTGNPLRGDFARQPSREEALKHFGLTPDRPVLLVVGGSLGCRTFNEMVKRAISEDALGDVQVIWQTGKFYEAEMRSFMAGRQANGIWLGAFIDRMDLAYAAADLVISRSGAGTVSELCLLGKATMFIPSPGVAEDHQTKNAMALVDKGAAEICPDERALTEAIPTALRLLGDRARLDSLAAAIGRLGIADSADRVAEIILKQR